MAVHVALLRGVNVGGHNKVPMADLRAALLADGFGNPRTYIQSGNIVLESDDDADRVVARVEALIGERFGLAVPTIVISASALADVVARNPYPAEADHRRLHAVFLREEPDEAERARVRGLVDASAAKGSPDAATFVGSTLYLHTPDGLGTSDLAKALTTKRRSGVGAGTARNWATVTTLLAMCSA